MLRRAVLPLTLATLAAAPALAANYPANHCEVFIEKVAAFPSSHSSGGLATVVKVGRFAAGEKAEKVGFYGRRVGKNLGNAAFCENESLGADTGWRIVEPTTDNSYAGPGEYFFNFPIHTGAVMSQCLGFDFTNMGTFFVQTNKNTYWVNPAMDSAQYFYFDANGYNNLQRLSYEYYLTSTDRDSLRYYNPLVCR